VRTHVLTAVMLAAAVGAGGCATAGPGTASCLPSPLQLSSKQIRAGSEVTVSSRPFACHASYPAGKTYRLMLLLVGRARPVNLGTVPVHRDGSFRAAVRMPPEAPPGEAAVKALGSVLDEPCTDTIVKSASCASYLIPFTLLSPPR